MILMSFVYLFSVAISLPELHDRHLSSDDWSVPSSLAGHGLSLLCWDTCQGTHAQEYKKFCATQPSICYEDTANIMTRTSSIRPRTLAVSVSVQIENDTKQPLK